MNFFKKGIEKFLNVYILFKLYITMDWFASAH